MRLTGHEQTINADITILCDGDGATIAINDRDAIIQFIEIELTAKQFMSLIGRLSNVPCKAKIRGLDKVGMVREHKDLVFPMSENATFREERKLACKLADQHVEPGWTPSHYFGSHGSFFCKDGVRHARTTQYRWVPKTESDEPQKGESDA